MRLLPGWKRLMRSVTLNLHISKCRAEGSSPCATMRGINSWCDGSGYPSEAIFRPRLPQNKKHAQTDVLAFQQASFTGPQRELINGDKTGSATASC